MRSQGAYNAHRQPVKFKEGDKVYLKDYPLSNAANKFTAKLANRFKGPYTVVKFYSPVTVGLRAEEGGWARAHVSQLKSAAHAALHVSG